MLSEGGPIAFTSADGVAILTLNRPDQGNVIDAAFAAALDAAVGLCENDPAIRCVLLTGTGKLFCGGGSVEAFADAGDDATRIVAQAAAAYHTTIARMLRMDKPLVTAVNGGAAGAGLGLAIMGDIVLASSNAHFTVGYTAIGFTPDGGTSWLLPRLIGLRRAQDLALTNRRVMAQEAAAIGLVTQVVPPDQLMEQALAIASGLARGATQALATTRRLLLDSLDTDLPTHLDAEAAHIARAAGSADGREGVRAFLEKRAPRFN